MYTIVAHNVRDALPCGVAYLLEHGVREESRNGPVLVSPCPVTTVYERPTERVLLSAVRDANPFFHLAEALWMLAGRNDAAFLNNFVRDFGERFAEPDGTIHGAYGHRWRQALGFDQLNEVVNKLRANSADRQAVIQMWDAVPTPQHDDYLGSDDLLGSWRDRPCNTHVYLRVRETLTPPAPPLRSMYRTGVLDIQVNCRSNDIIMGAYGANAVHFSVLQEYLAARIGVAVGRYYQVSFNYHAYERDLDRMNRRRLRVGDELDKDLVDDRDYETEPLVTDPDTFDVEVKFILALYEHIGDGSPDARSNLAVSNLFNKFLSGTVWPMLMAHRSHKLGQSIVADTAVAYWVSEIRAADWRTAALEWLERRRKGEPK